MLVDFVCTQQVYLSVGAYHFNRMSGMVLVLLKYASVMSLVLKISSQPHFYQFHSIYSYTQAGLQMVCSDLCVLKNCWERLYRVYTMFAPVGSSLGRCLELSLLKSLHRPSQSFLKWYKLFWCCFPFYAVSCLHVELVTMWLISDWFTSYCERMWVWETWALGFSQESLE